MKPLLWGPLFWKLLIELSNHAGESTLTKRQFIVLCSTLHHVLPCIYCRKSSIGFMQRLDILKYLDNLPEFVYMLKEEVNIKLLTHNGKLNVSYEPKLSLSMYEELNKAPFPKISQEQFWFLLNILVVDQIIRKQEMELYELDIFSTFVRALVDLVPHTSGLCGISIAPPSTNPAHVVVDGEKITSDPDSDLVLKIKKDPLYTWFQNQKSNNKVVMDEDYLLSSVKQQ
jgi:hypothetical protein